MNGRSITIVSDTATPELKARVAAAGPARMAARLAPKLAEHWRDTLKKLPKNRNGYPSTGFWEQAARKVRGINRPDSVLLYSDHLGLHKRLVGGPVKAVNVMNVTVPICAEAYGTTTKDWPPLGQGSVIVILSDGRKFWCLWMATGDTLPKTVTAAKTHERKTNAIRKFKESNSGDTNPKFIMFKGGGGGTVSKAERHMDLKFLFRLMPETGDQTPMPQVIPQDLAQFTREQVVLALGRMGA